MKPKVLILGATGRFGAASLQSFVKQGWDVIAQSRSAGLPTKGVHWLSAAPHGTQSIIAAAQGAQIVVHAWNPIYTAWAREVLPLGEHAMNIAQALNATLLLPGNVYNFGSAMPQLLSETTAQHADTRKGKLRVQLENAIAKRCENGLRAIVLRAGDFFGSGTGNWFDLVITKDLAKGRIVYPGPLDVPHAWAYLPDLAQAAVQLSQRAVSQAALFSNFEVFHFAGHTLTGQELCNAISAQHAAPTKIRTLPWSVISLGGLVVPMWRELAEMRYLWQTAHALDGAKLASRIGPIKQTVFADALRHTLPAPNASPHTALPTTTSKSI